MIKLPKRLAEIIIGLLTLSALILINYFCIQLGISVSAGFMVLSDKALIAFNFMRNSFKNIINFFLVTYTSAAAIVVFYGIARAVKAGAKFGPIGAGVVGAIVGALLGSALTWAGLKIYEGAQKAKGTIEEVYGIIESGLDPAKFWGYGRIIIKSKNEKDIEKRLSSTLKSIFFGYFYSNYKPKGLISTIIVENASCDLVIDVINKSFAEIVKMEGAAVLSNNCNKSSNRRIIRIYSDKYIYLSENSVVFSNKGEWDKDIKEVLRIIARDVCGDELKHYAFKIRSIVNTSLEFVGTVSENCAVGIQVISERFGAVCFDYCTSLGIDSDSCRLTCDAEEKEYKDAEIAESVEIIKIETIEIGETEYKIVREVENSAIIYPDRLRWAITYASEAPATAEIFLSKLINPIEMLYIEVI